MVGHEIRNPLAVINNSIYFIKMKVTGAASAPDPKVVKHISIIESEIRQANGIIDEILGFARTRELNPKVMSINSYLEEITMSFPVPEHIKLLKEFTSSDPQVSIDPDEMAQAVRNLIKNAIEVMPEKGTVYVRTAMLYEAGAFPEDRGSANSGSGTNAAEEPVEPIWKIQFSGGTGGVRTSHGHGPDASDISQARDIGESQADAFQLINKEQGLNYFIGWEMMKDSIYPFYAQVYTLLGSVEEAQWVVFKRITENATFFRKSYYLNAGTADCMRSPQSCADQGAAPFLSGAGKIDKGSGFKTVHIKKIEFYAKVQTPGNIYSPYYLGRTTPPMDMTEQTREGLFQFAGFTKSKLESLGRGLDVYQGWQAPSNYFNIDFNRLAACKETGKPCVHAKISTQCPNRDNFNNCVWPNPTPKYQTRLYP